MKTTGRNSSEVWERAQKLMPGGVNSPVRAFGAVGGKPVIVSSGSGACITDVDGNVYIDYVMSWGALILGHAHPSVVEAARKACEQGLTFGMPTETENLLAERILDCLPGIDRVRMVSSGTEAAMSAIRLARGSTGRDLVVKFDGCYHGHSDGLLVCAGSGVATFGLPGTKGIPQSYAEKTLVVPFNDEKGIAEIFERFGRELACVIVEPVAANMGVVPPTSHFLHQLRELTRRHEALLIFDEVITGFRLGLSGAQGLYEVTPDLTVLGKIMGGGMPAAAYGGRKELMAMLAPAGPVYQAGTLSGNPVAMASGLATLRTLMEELPYAHLENLSAMLGEGLAEAARKADLPCFLSRTGAMLTCYFTEGPVMDYESARRSDAGRYAKYFHGMLERGIHLAPSPFEAMFLSTAHTEEHIEKTIDAAAEVMETLA